MNSYNRVFFEGVLSVLNEKGGVTHVDYSRTDRAPLLIITGEIDHVVPPAIGEAIVKKYTADGQPRGRRLQDVPRPDPPSREPGRLGRDRRLRARVGDHPRGATGGREVAAVRRDPRRGTTSPSRHQVNAWCPGGRVVSRPGCQRWDPEGPGSSRPRALQPRACRRRSAATTSVVPAPRGGEDAGEDGGVVDHALVAHHAGVDSGAAQGMPIRVAVTAQRVVLGREDDRRRQALVDRARNGEAYGSSPRSRLDRYVRATERSSRMAMGRGMPSPRVAGIVDVGAREVDDGNLEHLQSKRKVRAVAVHERDRRGDVASGRGAQDADALGSTPSSSALSKSHTSAAYPCSTGTG